MSAGLCVAVAMRTLGAMSFVRSVVCQRFSAVNALPIITHRLHRFTWAGEITRDLSSGTLHGLQFTGSNALEHFPGGSTATFTLDPHVSARGNIIAAFCFRRQLLLFASFAQFIPPQGYAHGPFTSTFPGGSVAGTESYEHGVKVL